MYKQLLLFFCIIVFIPFCSCGSKKAKGTNGITYNSAAEYNQYIVERQTDVLKMVFSYIDTLQSKPQSALQYLSKNVEDIDSIIKNLKGMPAYNGNTEMRDTAIELFDFYYSAFNNEYKQLTELLLSLGPAGATAEQLALNDSLTASITRREEMFVKKFIKTQKDFAKENRLRLEENKMQKEFEEKLNNLN